MKLPSTSSAVLGYYLQCYDNQFILAGTVKLHTSTSIISPAKHRSTYIIAATSRAISNTALIDTSVWNRYLVIQIKALTFTYEYAIKADCT